MFRAERRQGRRGGAAARGQMRPQGPQMRPQGPDALVCQVRSSSRMEAWWGQRTRPYVAEPAVAPNSRQRVSAHELRSGARDSARMAACALPSLQTCLQEAARGGCVEALRFFQKTLCVAAATKTLCCPHHCHTCRTKTRAHAAVHCSRHTPLLHPAHGDGLRGALRGSDGRPGLGAAQRLFQV
jgi:hypothetical protein